MLSGFTDATPQTETQPLTYSAHGCSRGGQRLTIPVSMVVVPTPIRPYRHIWAAYTRATASASLFPKSVAMRSIATRRWRFLDKASLLPKSVATRSIAARRLRFLSKASCSHRFGTRNSASDGKRHSSSRASGEQCFCQEASLDMHERPGGTLPVKGVVLAEHAVRTDPNRISGSPIRTQRRLRPTRTHALMGSPILAACTCRTGPPRAAKSLMCQVSSLRSLRHRRATAGRM